MASDEDRLKERHCKPPLTPVNEEELRNLHKKFNTLDKDKSGCLEPNEFFDLPCSSCLIFRTC